eukprot:1157890-Pelagomonas_calceolata.AAC.7
MTFHAVYTGSVTTFLLHIHSAFSNLPRPLELYCGIPSCLSHHYYLPAHLELNRAPGPQFPPLCGPACCAWMPANAHLFQHLQLPGDDAILLQFALAFSNCLDETLKLTQVAQELGVGDALHKLVAKFIHHLCRSCSARYYTNGSFHSSRQRKVILHNEPETYWRITSSCKETPFDANLHSRIPVGGQCRSLDSFKIGALRKALLHSTPPLKLKGHARHVSDAHPMDLTLPALQCNKLRALQTMLIGYTKEKLFSWVLPRGPKLCKRMPEFSFLP